MHILLTRLFLFILVCHLDFKKAILRIDSDDARNSTILEVKRDDEIDWDFCLEYPKPIDYVVHTYFSSGGIHKDRRAIYLNSIKFYDNEEEVYEGETQDE